VPVKLGFGKHVTFDPSLHHHFSVNDNCAQGGAKKEWRARISDFSDDVNATVLLLKLLSRPAETIKGYFESNLQLSNLRRGWLDEDALRGLLRNRQGNIPKAQRAYIYEYRLYMKMDGRGGESAGYDDLLDGIYWAPS
jgi:hypothetical protein